jgi:hypothetical protein
VRVDIDVGNDVAIVVHASAREIGATDAVTCTHFRASFP